MDKFPLTVLLGVAISTMTLSANAVVYLDPAQGLPDYDKQPAFSVSDAGTVEALKREIATIQPGEHRCATGRMKVWDTWTLRLYSNVCGAQHVRTLRQLVAKLAPALKSERLTFWIVKLASAEPALIVGHIDLSSDQVAPYPFLSLWRLRIEEGSYRAVYAGPFLDGELHAVKNFGPNPNQRIVFIKHVSCIECEATTYLTPIDFDATGDARPFEFSYSEDHEDFGPTLEYDLPGMGHTVDAKVETRILPPSAQGPHLLQSFKMAEGEGPDEWWAFKCVGYRCDYEIYKGKAPPNFKRLWSKANKL